MDESVMLWVGESFVGLVREGGGNSSFSGVESVGSWEGGRG